MSKMKDNLDTENTKEEWEMFVLGGTPPSLVDDPEEEEAPPAVYCPQSAWNALLSEREVMEARIRGAHIELERMRKSLRDWRFGCAVLALGILVKVFLGS